MYVSKPRSWYRFCGNKVNGLMFRPSRLLERLFYGRYANPHGPILIKPVSTTKLAKLRQKLFNRNGLPAKTTLSLHCCDWCLTKCLLSKDLIFCWTALWNWASAILVGKQFASHLIMFFISSLDIKFDWTISELHFQSKSSCSLDAWPTWGHDGNWYPSSILEPLQGGVQQGGPTEGTTG